MILATDERLCVRACVAGAIGLGLHIGRSSLPCPLEIKHLTKGGWAAQ
jgi:hypothetical protein